MSKRRRKKIPSDPQSAQISSLSHEGRGVSKIDGKTTFLFNGLPGEEVLFKYNTINRQYDEGTVIEVKQAASMRTTPLCEFFGICGGCSLQHMQHDFQIQHKQNTLLELLQHQANTQPTKILPPLTDAIWGYRHKARLSVKNVPRKNKVMVGFRERGYRFVADMNHCEVLHPSIGKKITALSEMIQQLEQRDEIRQLEVAISDHESAIIIRHMQPLPDSDITLIKAFAKQHTLKIYLQPDGIDSIELLYPETADTLLEYGLPDFALTMHFHPAQFTQINPAINKKMIKQALQLLELQPDDTVLDLFCGIGNFTLPTAKYAKRVVGVEVAADAIQQAEKNAITNNITNCEFHVANLDEPVAEKSWSKSSYNKLILDPPRSGAEAILTMLPHWQPERIVYVSCNPNTLARDTKAILEHGYQLDAAGIMDMFPHTQHVEAMCLFVKT